MDLHKLEQGVKPEVINCGRSSVQLIGHERREEMSVCSQGEGSP